MPPAELRLPAASGWALPAVLSAALVLGLVVQAALPTAEPERAVPSPRPARIGGPVAALNTPSSGGDGAEALTRPPFSPSRSTGGPVSTAPTLGLLGVARMGGAALATVQDPAGGTRTLQVGESFEGWRLSAVGADRAVLDHDGETHTLHVGERATAATPSSTQPAGAPSPAAPSSPGGST